MKVTRLTDNLLVLHGAVNTGVARSGHRAILIDCCDSVTPAVLAELGITHVDRILCTQHRRPNTAGAAGFLDQGARLVVSATDRPLFEDVATYWGDWKNRWYLYHEQPGPQVLPHPLPVAQAVREGDTIDWEGFRISVLETPGATDGSVSYRIEAGKRCFCFCGDTLCGAGQILDLYSLQRGFASVCDYHGFMGNRLKLIASLKRLARCGAKRLVPSHGKPIGDPASATALTIRRLERLWRNFTATSALRSHFPGLLDEPGRKAPRMAPGACGDSPSWIQRIPYTSFAVVSDSGAALLIDCGHHVVFDALERLHRDNVIRGVEGCWITHYHDDHVDGLPRLAHSFGWPIMTDQHVTEVIEHPGRFFLPCISPACAPVARSTGDGDSWQWHEFRLTAFHFPGQTFHHSGLLVEGHGARVFFAGDSLAPSGLDDYSCPNRLFFGPGKGWRRCLDILRECRPDAIYHQHIDAPFSFTQRQLDYMERHLAARERLLAELLPWEDINFGIDEWWCRTYPYEQEAAPGARLSVDVQFTNHGAHSRRARVEPVLPMGWTCDRRRSRIEVRVPANTSGSVAAFEPRPDQSARVWISVPGKALPGRYVVPIRVTWGRQYLGQFRHAIVNVR